MWSPLNWREIESLAATYRPLLEGLSVERVFIPAWPKTPEGYLKGVWALTAGAKDRVRQTLFFSVRSGLPFVLLEPYDAKNPSHRPAAGAPRSAFDLALAKGIEGSRIQKLSVYPRDRTLSIHFGRAPEQTALILALIPARPEAWWVKLSDETGSSASYPILAKTRGNADVSGEIWHAPIGAPAGPLPVLREFANPETYAHALREKLEHDAWVARITALNRVLKSHRADLLKRIATSQSHLDSASREKDWQKLGDLWKAHLPQVTELLKRNPNQTLFELLDYETGSTTPVERDLKKSASEQLKHFYHLAQRRKTRETEANERLTNARRALSILNESNAPMDSVSDGATLDWARLEAQEAQLGISRDSNDSKKAHTPWSGRSFTSDEGLLIRVGRNKSENLELTLKLARGNDLWLHIKGRPSAHGVIHLPAGKSASLETLLDAAHLVIFHSGGAEWGRVDVDYTLRKYVKRIKGSDQVSYTQNKTLRIDLDADRLKRLLASGN